LGGGGEGGKGIYTELQNCPSEGLILEGQRKGGLFGGEAVIYLFPERKIEKSSSPKERTREKKIRLKFPVIGGRLLSEGEGGNRSVRFHENASIRARACKYHLGGDTVLPTGKEHRDDPG